MLFLTCGCETISNITRNENITLNEKFLASLSYKDKYDPRDTIVSSEKKSMPDYPSDLVYAILYKDKDGLAVMFEYYFLPKDMLMFTETDYDRGLYTYKRVTEYNRDFYDHLSEYGAPEDWYNDLEKWVQYTGTEYQNIMQLCPGLDEYYHVDGSFDRTQTLLLETGYTSAEHEEYNADGDLVWLAKNEDDDADYDYSETFWYDDAGALVRTDEYFFDESKVLVTYYENGEETGTETFDTETFAIDEYGNIAVP